MGSHNTGEKEFSVSNYFRHDPSAGCPVGIGGMSSFVTWPSHTTIDHASLTRRGCLFCNSVHVISLMKQGYDHCKGNAV